MAACMYHTPPVFVWSVVTALGVLGVLTDNRKEAKIKQASASSIMERSTKSKRPRTRISKLTCFAMLVAAILVAFDPSSHNIKPLSLFE